MEPIYEVRPRKDKRGVDLISDALPLGRYRTVSLTQSATRTLNTLDRGWCLVRLSASNIVDPLQEQHERWVGDQVIQRYNSDHGASFQFYGRAGVAPDLEYREGSRWLRVEVVTAYYDDEDAKFIWLRARKRPNTPAKWSGVNFEQSADEFRNDLHTREKRHGKRIVSPGPDSKAYPTLRNTVKQRRKPLSQRIAVRNMIP